MQFQIHSSCCASTGSLTPVKYVQTFYRLEVAEFSAKSIVMAKPIGELLPISDNQVDELRKVFLKK